MTTPRDAGADAGAGIGNTADSTAAVGIIANPASGKDIRRLVAHASVFDTPEKINIVRRVLIGLDAAGVRHVYYMPDPSRIVEQAADGATLTLRIEPVPGRFHGVAQDTTDAAAAMAQLDLAAIVSLGGDGTNRAIAKGARTIPLIPISTGTNNVFPVLIEGTVAGLAAGAIARRIVDPATVAYPCKIITVTVDDQPHDLALIDAAVMEGAHIGSRAIWQTDAIREVVLTRAQPDVIGLAAVGGMVASVTPDDDTGLHLLLGDPQLGDPSDPSNAPAPGRTILPGAGRLRAAIGPGLVQELAIARVELLPFGDIVPLTGPALLALDGEREFRLRPDQHAALSVDRSGPPVVDIGQCLDAARDAGFLRIAGGDH
jgi:hypothetical protein